MYGRCQKGDPPGESDSPPDHGQSYGRKCGVLCPASFPQGFFIRFHILHGIASYRRNGSKEREEAKKKKFLHNNRICYELSRLRLMSEKEFLINFLFLRKDSEEIFFFRMKIGLKNIRKTRTILRERRKR